MFSHIVNIHTHVYSTLISKRKCFSSVAHSVMSNSVTPWTAAHQASLSITNSHSFLKLIHQVGDAIQPLSSHPLSSPSAFNLSQHQGLFQWVTSLHQVARVLELQHQSFQGVFRTDFRPVSDIWIFRMLQINVQEMFTFSFLYVKLWKKHYFPKYFLKHICVYVYNFNKDVGNVCLYSACYSICIYSGFFYSMSEIQGK